MFTFVLILCCVRLPFGLVNKIFNSVLAPGQISKSRLHLPLITVWRSGGVVMLPSGSERSPAAKRFFVQFTAQNLQICWKFHPRVGYKTPVVNNIVITCKFCAGDNTLSAINVWKSYFLNFFFAWNSGAPVFGGPWTLPTLLTPLLRHCLRRLETWHCSHLLLTAVLLWIIWIERRPRLMQTRRAAIDRYRQPAGPTAANPPHAAAAVDRWDRQTDGRTDARQFHRPCCGLPRGQCQQ